MGAAMLVEDSGGWGEGCDTPLVVSEAETCRSINNRVEQLSHKLTSKRTVEVVVRLPAV